jgi:regulator of protease activity HflC (stomatin/prohibitin superfamily)
MLDRLFEALHQWGRWFLPFAVIDAYQRGVVLRAGQHHRDLAPGFHWIIPFGVEKVLEDNVVPRTVNLQSQSLTTRDGVGVVVGGVVTASISSIRRALLEVEGVDDALRDSCLGVISQKVTAATWEEVRDPSFVDTLTQGCREQASEYGLRIKRVQLSDCAKVRALRLHVDQVPVIDQLS